MSDECIHWWLYSQSYNLFSCSFCGAATSIEGAFKNDDDWINGVPVHRLKSSKPIDIKEEDLQDVG